MTDSADRLRRSSKPDWRPEDSLNSWRTGLLHSRIHTLVGHVQQDTVRRSARAAAGEEQVHAGQKQVARVKPRISPRSATVATLPGLACWRLQATLLQPDPCARFIGGQQTGVSIWRLRRASFLCAGAAARRFRLTGPAVSCTPLPIVLRALGSSRCVPPAGFC